MERYRMDEWTHLVNQRLVFPLKNNLESTGSVIPRVKPHNPSRLPEFSEPDVVLKIPLLDVGGLWIMEHCAAGHRVLVVEVTANLEVTRVAVKRIVVETHLTRNDNSRFDVEYYPLGPRDPEPRHLTQDVVFLKFLETVNFQIWFPQKF